MLLALAAAVVLIVSACGGSSDPGASAPEDVGVTETVAVANGQYFGGGMHVAPDAELDDGKFDVVAIGDLGVGQMFMSSRRLYAGTHLSMKDVSHRRARTVHAEPVEPGAVVELDVDGETPGRLPATFTVVPQGLCLVVP